MRQEDTGTENHRSEGQKIKGEAGQHRRRGAGVPKSALSPLCLEIAWQGLGTGTCPHPEKLRVGQSLIILYENFSTQDVTETMLEFSSTVGNLQH